MAGVRGERWGVIAAGVLILGGCVSIVAETTLRAQSEFVGMPKQALLSCAGVPHRQATVDDREYLTYASSRVYGGGSGLAWVGGPGMPYHWATVPQPEVSSETCEATFTLRNGKVERLVYGADGATGQLGQCYAIIRNCIPQPPK